jgi:uncharacterized protein (TIRG00374 family)
MSKLFLLALASFAFIFVWLLGWAGFQDVAAAFMTINPVYIPFIVLLPFAMLLVYSARWNLLLRSVGVETSWRIVIKYAFIGAAFNNITPMVRFGGEPVKCYMLSKEISASKRRVLASLAMDSLITAITLLILVYLGLVSLAMFNILEWFTLYIILVVIILPLSVGFYILYDKRALAAVSLRLSGLVSRFSPPIAKKLPGGMMKFRDSLRDSLKRRDAMAMAFVLGMVERMLEVLGLYLIFQSLGIPLDMFMSAIVLGVGVVAGLVPLLPGGIIAYESVTIIVLRLFNVSPALAATSILLWRGVTYWLITGVGMGLGWLHGVRFAFKDYFESGSDSDDGSEQI